jgi:protein ImuB
MNTTTPLYACLRVREFAAQAVVRQRPELREQPVAVLVGVAPLQLVAALNLAARHAGAARGMTRAEAESIPGLTLLERSAAAEASARLALLECAAWFTPFVEECRGLAACSPAAGNRIVASPIDALFVLDIAGTGTLFGEPRKLAAELLARMQAVGLRASVAVSASVPVARSVARAQRERIAVVEQGREAEALARLPLTVLELNDQQASTFADWGIHTLGELATLPEHALVARVGQQGRELRRLALGTASHLFVPLEEDLALEERMEFEEPVELLDSLLFVLRVQLERLMARAAAHLLTLAELTVTLGLEGGAAHERVVRPAVASNDLALWMKLVQLDLAAHPPQAAIVSLTLAAETGDRARVQLGLFATQTPEPGKLDVTLARLRALVGEECVGAAELEDAYRPDGFRMTPFRLQQGKTRRDVEPELEQDAEREAAPRAASRMLRPPVPVRMTLNDGVPAGFIFRGAHYGVERAYGPWIASGEWWNPELWAVQQWDVVARGATRELLFCSLSFYPLDKTWQMDALYD